MKKIIPIFLLILLSGCQVTDQNVEPETIDTVVVVEEELNTNDNKPELATDSVFSIDNVEIGDEIAGLTLLSMEPFKSEFDDLNEGNAIIKFEGEIHVSGEVFFALIEDLPCFSPTEEDEKYFPRIEGDQRNIWLCFANQEFAVEQFGLNGTEASIVIKNYTINVFPAEVWNSAELIRVIDY